MTAWILLILGLLFVVAHCGYYLYQCWNFGKRIKTLIEAGSDIAARVIVMNGLLSEDDNNEISNLLEKADYFLSSAQYKYPKFRLFNFANQQKRIKEAYAALEEVQTSFDLCNVKLDIVSAKFEN